MRGPENKDSGGFHVTVELSEVLVHGVVVNGPRREHALAYVVCPVESSGKTGRVARCRDIATRQEKHFLAGVCVSVEERWPGDVRNGVLIVYEAIEPGGECSGCHLVQNARGTEGDDHMRLEALVGEALGRKNRERTSKAVPRQPQYLLVRAHVEEGGQ